MQAAEAQFTAWPGAKLAAVTVARLAKGVTPLDKKIAEVDALVEARFREHPHGWEAFDRRTETAWWSRKNVERGGGEGAFRRSVP
ncbi:transposase, undefined [Streptomyces albus]|uniref:Transposase, undefined n=1 Tax=Streptomyces albus (strain ATCC 21838 / DSM 41398 / FERM P-419 / JCM 4703 / NBRC 107858) TaxID=1081613 RepID=A0A0B5EXH7_STRA4|nr:transposase, undefined [Streptomyces albus]AOU77657.1 transposase, undefined [Streptomyces albus]